VCSANRTGDLQHMASHSKMAPPAKRKQKADDNDSDTLYAGDLDVDDDTTYQTYKPKPTRSRRNRAPVSSPAKKRKIQPAPRQAAGRPYNPKLKFRGGRRHHCCRWSEAW
jgi:hypothetical protein